jgi:hypothetical protein
MASDFFKGLTTPPSVQADQPIPYKWKELKALGD